MRKDIQNSSNHQTFCRFSAQNGKDSSAHGDRPSVQMTALSMMIPGLFAGALQESVGYPAFFVIVVVACVMTYVVTSLLRIDPEFGKKQS